jgi:hypothetical protein
MELLTVADLCECFLNQKREAVDSGELSIRTWRGDFKRTCDIIVANFGKSRAVTDLRPDDFASLRNKLARTNDRTAWASLSSAFAPSSSMPSTRS